MLASTCALIMAGAVEYNLQSRPLKQMIADKKILSMAHCNILTLACSLDLVGVQPQRRSSFHLWPKPSWAFTILSHLGTPYTVKSLLQSMLCTSTEGDSETKILQDWNCHTVIWKPFNLFGFVQIRSTKKAFGMFQGQPWALLLKACEDFTSIHGAGESVARKPPGLECIHFLSFFHSGNSFYSKKVAPNLCLVFSPGEFWFWARTTSTAGGSKRVAAASTSYVLGRMSYSWREYRGTQGTRSALWQISTSQRDIPLCWSLPFVYHSQLEHMSVWFPVVLFFTHRPVQVASPELFRALSAFAMTVEAERLGLKYVEDFKERIPRSEAEELIKVVSNAADKAYGNKQAGFKRVRTCMRFV